MSYEVIYAATCLVCYLLAAIPSGFLLVKLKTGKDVRDAGSGNIGATNVARSLGVAWFIPVFLFDFMKGFATVFWLAPWVASTWRCSTCPNPTVALAVFCGLFAMMGHMWPVFLKFRGGKGVATVGGVVFALSWQAALLTMAVFLIAFAISRMVALGSIAGAVTMPLASHFTESNLGAQVVQTEHWVITAFLALAGGIVIVKHRSNIRRILKGTEIRVRKMP